jgi:hypothetical protein
MHSAVLPRVHTCSSTVIRLSRYVSLPCLTHRREGRQPAVPHTASSIDSLGVVLSSFATVTDENGVDCQLNNPSIICWKEEKTLFFLPNLFSFIFHDDVGIIIVLYRGHFSCVVYVPPICCVSSTFRRTVARLVALAEVYRHVNRSHPGSSPWEAWV